MVTYQACHRWCDIRRFNEVPRMWKTVFSCFLKTCEDGSRKPGKHKQVKQTVSDASVVFHQSMGVTSVDPWNVNNTLFLKCLKLSQQENVILLILAQQKDTVRMDGKIFCHFLSPWLDLGIAFVL